MNQIICFGGTIPGSTGWYLNPLASRTRLQEFPETHGQVLWPTAGTIRNFRVRLTTAPGAGTSRSLTWRKNGSNAGLAVTISDTATEGTDTSSFSVVADDLISIAETRTGAPATADCTCSFEFEPTSTTESVYGFGGTPNQTSVRYTGLFFSAGNGSWDATASEGDETSLVATTGTITTYKIRATAAPGSGKSWTTVIYVNDVKQDGSGGTTDTSATIADTNQTATWTGTLALSAGDRVSVECTPSGTPTSSNVWGSVLFNAASANSAHFGCSQNGTPTASSTTYYWPFGRWSNTPNTTTESEREQVSNPTTLTLSGLRFRMYGDAPAGDPLPSDVTATLRKNQQDTALTVTIPSGTSMPHTETFTGVDQVEIADGDEFDLAVTVAGSIGSTNTFTAVFVQGTPPIPSSYNLLTGQGHSVEGSHNVIAGKDGTLTGNRVVLLSLDGSAHTWSGEGKLVIFGDVEIHGSITFFNSFTATGGIQTGASPSAGTVAFSGYAPTLVRTDSYLSPSAGTTALTGLTPTVTVSG